MYPLVDELPRPGISNPLCRGLLHRVSHIGKIKYRHSHQAERAVVNLRRAVHIHGDFARVELPLRTRQMAGRHCALAHQVMLGPMLLDDFSGECKRIGGRQHIARPAAFEANGSRYVVKCPNLRLDVVTAVASLHVLIVGTAIEHHVPL